MKWADQPPDVTPAPVAGLLRSLSALDAIVLVSRMRTSPLVSLSPACREGIFAHLRTRRTELGGLLIGWPHIPVPGLPETCGAFVEIVGFLPSQTFQTSGVSLAMGTEVWDRARDAIAGQRGLVVGWYHSHPNLGAFFSCTDRATQRSFFNRPYSIGLVIDPVREEEAWFVGPDSTRLESHAILGVNLSTRASSRPARENESER